MWTATRLLYEPDKLDCEFNPIELTGIQYWHNHCVSVIFMCYKTATYFGIKIDLQIGPCFLHLNIKKCSQTTYKHYSDRNALNVSQSSNWHSVTGVHVIAAFFCDRREHGFICLEFVSSVLELSCGFRKHVQTTGKTVNKSPWDLVQMTSDCMDWLLTVCIGMLTCNSLTCTQGLSLWACWPFR